jgi:hypothetical protein
VGTLNRTLNGRLGDTAVLTYTRPDTIQGDPGTQLEGYLSETITVPPETMRDSVSSSFPLPRRQQSRP